MKKIILSILAVGCLFTSCDMDLKQDGTILDNESIQTVKDIKEYRNLCYNLLRSYMSGSYVTDSEIQADFFLGLRGNGGRGSRMAQGTFVASSSETTGKYTACYRNLKQINYMIEKAKELVDAGAFEGNDLAEVNRYMGEAYFTRAYTYYWLFDHYCQAYSPDKADKEGLGLQLVTKYEPNMAQADYPGRSSMKATIDLINSDLNEAYKRLKDYEQTDGSQLIPCANYLSSVAVEALQARMALLTGDYSSAIAKAESVIAAPNFGLATGEDYINMWTTDKSSEVIFQPFADQNERAYVSSYYEAWIFPTDYPDRVDYVPTVALTEAYDWNTDLRTLAFFEESELTVDAQVTYGYIFTKFKGNPVLDPPSGNSYKNIPKPFRISEQYLILAEAAAESNQSGIANKALADLRAARIIGYDKQTSYAGSALINEIRDERAKELVGEGFRISDLRRWGLGFSRIADYYNVPGYAYMGDLFILGDVNTVYTSNDYRYAWPIPYDEIRVVEALKSQQNPGY